MANQKATRQVDVITKADLDIFKLARDESINHFTNYYFKTPTSGTYWRKTLDPFDEDKYNAWVRMYNAWMDDDHPLDAWEYRDIK